MGCCCTGTACVGCRAETHPDPYLPGPIPNACCQCSSVLGSDPTSGTNFSCCWDYTGSGWPAACSALNIFVQLQIQSDSCHWECVKVDNVFDLKFDGTNWIFKVSKDGGATFIVYVLSAADFNCYGGNTFAYSTGTCAGSGVPSIAILSPTPAIEGGLRCCPQTTCPFTLAPATLTIVLHSDCPLLDGLTIPMPKSGGASSWVGGPIDLGNGTCLYITLADSAHTVFDPANGCFFYELLLGQTEIPHFEPPLTCDDVAGQPLCYFSFGQVLLPDCDTLSCSPFYQHYSPQMMSICLTPPCRDINGNCGYNGTCLVSADVVG